jgi:alpha-D-xyloside xylohydrolase
MRRFVTCSFLLLFVAAISMAQQVQVPCKGMNVVVTFYTQGIVRVMKYPSVMDRIPDKKSYSVILTPNAKVKQTNVADGVILQSDLLVVKVNKNDGQLTFTSAKGEPLLKEHFTDFVMRSGDADAGKYKVSQSWMLDSDEDIYGLGQLRDKAMNQRHRKADIWNHNTYISIPYFTSVKGYGVYWDNAGRSAYDDTKEATEFSSEVGLCTDYYFIYRDGTQDGVIAGIRELTGQATMFPLWTMGHWQCRERYKTSDELTEVLDKYRELHIPLDGIVQDWQYWGCDSNWNAMRFMNPYYINKVGDPAWAKYLPDDMKKMAADYVAAGKTPRIKTPQAMVDYVHQHNAHLMISIWANFGPWTEPYQELKKINALLPFDTWPKKRGVLPYDPFNPKARDIYWHYLTNLYKMGFDAWWTDSSEPDHFEKPGDDDCMTYDGTWRSVKNAFPLMTNKGIYEHQRAMKDNDKRSVQMTRSGTFGIQHYGTFSWSGDIHASWEEMKQQIPSGLNYSLCGIPFWNTDLGGFFYWQFKQDPQNPAIQELQTRWMEWGTFMPLMRNHCSSPMVSELYHFGKPGDWAYDAMVDAIRLRYRLLPYIYSTAGDVVQHSGSMMRPLVMDFKEDQTARNLNDEYMFGRSLLVKPVTDAMYTWKDDQKCGHEIYPDIKKAAAPTQVYLPKGARWYDFWTNELLDGGKQIQKLCPIDVMPVYVKAGTILPFGPAVQYSNEKAWDELEIRIYPGADGAFTLYEDEGDNYHYEHGAFSEIRFDWNDARQQLTVQNRKGKFKGMLNQRKFNVVLVGPDSGNGRNPMSGRQLISYNGSKITLNIGK